jgi:hypothetical protein
MIHSFSERLAYSQSYEERLEALYRHVYPHMIDTCYVDSLKWQQRGIDRVVVFDGYTYRFDEKIRTGPWKDVLLELWSVWKGVGHPHNRVGWAADKHKVCDYILYVYADQNRARIFSYPSLRNAFLTHCWDWNKKYKQRHAKNKNYWTCNIPVPLDVLREAMK